MLKLDFSIVGSDDRSKFVNAFFDANPDYKPTQSELETLSNYILFGKDTDGTSIVDRGEIEIDTKYNSYKKRKAESLDELMDMPGFNENTIVTKYVYRHPKPPKIDRNDPEMAAIPGMKELWEAIDRLAYILGVCDGTIEQDPSKPIDTSVYSQTDLYKLKHSLIDLRKQQYVIKELHRPIEHSFNPNVHKGSCGEAPQQPIDWEQYWFYPLGLRLMPLDGRFDCPQDYEKKLTPWDRLQSLDEPRLRAKNIIDFTNSEHIYLLAKQYQNLSVGIEQDHDGLCAAIIDTLEFYAARANLTESRQLIWDMKCGQCGNNTIREKVNSQFGTSYNENYISTLFKQNICGDIAEAARIHADYFLNRDNESAWKICTHCGQRKLRDTREFMRKAKSSDGLASRCKKCESKVRAERKAAKAAEA